MKIALAHHWVMSYRGGEKVLEQIAQLCPDAELYLLTHDRSIEVPLLKDRVIHTSALNRVPFISKLYKHLLPIHPLAIRRMRVPNDIDLLISSDASLIKGIRLGPNTRHVCYCHSPPRYLWELGDDYKRTSSMARLALDRVAKRLRRFDSHSAQRVDHFIANSHFVANRISKYYQREATVVYPPVDTEAFDPSLPREPFHLVLSELTPYKRIDLAVSAYSRLSKPLIVIGDGSERKNLEAIASDCVKFVGRLPFLQVKRRLETCEAFVFPGIEDFGITPVEAQAAGAPVIAFRAGGALETVVEGKTGVFFDEQTTESLADAVKRMAPSCFPIASLRTHAETFSQAAFRHSLRSALQSFRVELPTTETNKNDAVPPIPQHLRFQDHVGPAPAGY